mmetsp:Transcript_19944/g.48832  ORF Transcript_19944/g.48832 Transcript_19944/m.48832 type:complete len:276 (+) Transcript_19944:165-992(+)
MLVDRLSLVLPLCSLVMSTKASAVARTRSSFTSLPSTTLASRALFRRRDFGRLSPISRAGGISEEIPAFVDMALRGAEIEYPQYKTLERRASYRVRLYPEGLCITLKDGGKLDMRDQIRILADYIGTGVGEDGSRAPPKNKNGEMVPIVAPIAMPAAQLTGGNRPQVLRLRLSPDFDPQKAPHPTDPRIQVVKVPEHVCAVRSIQKKGGSVQNQFQDLLAVLDRDGHTVDKESSELLHYRAPWFNPMFNSDEIAIGLRRYVHCRENRDTLWCTEY